MPQDKTLKYFTDFGKMKYIAISINLKGDKK